MGLVFAVDRWAVRIRHPVMPAFASGHIDRVLGKRLDILIL
jgi:hypothetical protein